MLRFARLEVTHEVPLTRARATMLVATLERCILALRADDRSFRATEIVERISAVGGTVVIDERTVSVTMRDLGIWAECQRRHVDWPLTLQACLNILLERTRTLEVSE